MEPTTRVAPASPVLVLGAPRAGTRLASRALAAGSGIEVLDAMPGPRPGPLPDFAMAATVHNTAMRRIDRDWTSPPGHHDLGALLDDFEFGALRDEVADLATREHPWGMRDPRLLFLLPLWARVVDVVQFVGVIRRHDDVVRALAEVDGLEAGMADAIARAYEERMLHLRDRVAFPIIDMSQAVDGVVDDLAVAAGLLGLAWDGTAAGEVLGDWDDERVALDGEDGFVAQVRSMSTASSDPVTATALRELVAALPEPPRLDRHVGPRSVERRAALWNMVRPDGSQPLEVLSWAHVASGAHPGPEDASILPARSPNDLLAGLRQRGRRDWSTVVLVDPVHWVPPDQLAATLRTLRRHMAGDGVLAVGISDADRAVVAVRSWPQPSLADLQAALTWAGFDVVATTAHDDVTGVRAVAHPVVDVDPPDDLELMEARAEVAAQRADAAEQRAEVARLREVAEDQRARMTALEQQAASWRELYDRLRGRSSVRAALRVAEAAKPAVQAVHRLRGGGRSS